MKELLVWLIIFGVAVMLEFGFGYVLTRIGGQIGLGIGITLLILDLIGEIKSVYTSITVYGLDAGIVVAIFFKVFCYVFMLAGLGGGLKKHEEA